MRTGFSELLRRERVVWSGVGRSRPINTRRAYEALGPASWEMKEEPDGEDCLDGQVGICLLTARLAILLWRLGRDGLL